jgi:branched-chain amino acid transport system substrate-binding protein
VVVALVVLAAAAGIGLVEGRSDGGSIRLGSVAPDSVAVIDPATNGIVAGVRVGSAPTAIAVGEGAVWVANAGDSTVSRIDPEQRRVVATLPLGRIPGQVTTGEGAVWVANPIGMSGAVTRIDPASNAIETTTVRLGDGGDVFAPPSPTAIAVGAGSVWTNLLREQIASFAPDTPSSIRQTDLGALRSSDGIAVGEGAVWVTSSADDTLVRLEPDSGRIAAAIPIAAAWGERVAGPFGIAIGYGSVWVADTLADALTRVDPGSNTVTATVGVGRRPTHVAVGNGAVWVLNVGEGTVSRVDPETLEVEATIPVGTSATSLATGSGSVWVTVGGGKSEPVVSDPKLEVERLPETTCSDVLYRGGGRPDFLIASDLPTYSDGRGASARTRQMRDAITFVLARHGFRAGRYRLAYQSCDNSTSTDGQASPERCAANARAYARNRSLLGIVGTFVSYCAAIELPILNAAPGGPLAMVSPANTYVGLTRGGPGTTATEPERYYPTGTRTYARVIAADDAQGAALAVLAKQLGTKRLYLLHGNQGTGYAIARYADAAARSLELEIVGIAAWDPESADQTGLARDVAEHHPDAVVLGGCVCENGLPLIGALRSALGPRVKLLASDGFTWTSPDYSTIADAADGLYITGHALPVDRLPAPGRRFASALARDLRVSEVDPFAVYAAQATEVLIAAVARSNGTRSSVAGKLLSTRVTDGLIGTFDFDRHGDPTPAPISVFRLDFSAPRALVDPLLPHAVLDRVIAPPPGLLE